MPYFNSTDSRIFYRQFGLSRNALILLNGGPGRSSDTFIPLAKKISKLGVRTVIFDQRGTGKSSIPITSQNITIDHMVDDLESLRKHLKLEKLSVLGHSFGGVYALAYAQRYPKKISSLILSASAGPDSSWKVYILENLLSRITPEARQKYHRLTKGKQHIKALRQLLPGYVFNVKHVPLVEENLLDPRYYLPKVTDLVWKSLGSYDFSGTLTSFKAPTLIIHGRQDMLGEAVALRLKEEISHAKLVFFNECGHYPWLDQPKDYFTEISKHLKL